MKCILITKVNVDHPALLGVWKKIRGQVEGLEALGNQVDLMYIQDNSVVVESQGYSGRIRPFKSYLSRFCFYHFGLFAWLRANRGFQAVLVRHFRMDPVVLLQFWILKKWGSPGTRIILELPTYPYDREVDRRRVTENLEDFLDRFSTNSLSRFCFDRILTYSRFKKIWGVATIQTDNGISTTGVTDPQRAPISGVVRMIAVTSVDFWQGLDRIMKGMGHYKQDGSETIELHIVGSGAALGELKTLAGQLGIQDQVIFHGPKSGPELESLWAQAHIGVGSLGRHRTGNESGQTTSLKAREYALQGIPFFQSMRDHDFTEAYPYCLYVPSDDTPIDLNSVVNWYRQLVIDDPMFANQMHEDARLRLSWKKKLEPLNNYLHDKFTENVSF